MGKRLDRQHAGLYRATDEVLHYLWDPIGVSDSAYARDEYWRYLPQVFGMLIDQSTKESIVEYLTEIEAHRMGLPPNEERANRIVEILFEYKEKLLTEQLS